MIQKNDGIKAKLLLLSEDGETFLCIRQFFANSLRTGRYLDNKNYQGLRFKLIKEANDEQQGQKEDIRSQC